MQPSPGFVEKEQAWGIADYISALFQSLFSLFIPGDRLSVVKVNIPEKNASSGTISMKSHYFLGNTRNLNDYIETFQNNIKQYRITDHFCLIGREITIIKSS